MNQNNIHTDNKLGIIHNFRIFKQEGDIVKHIALALAIATTSAVASVPKDLAYPTAALTTADQVIDQVYYVNHFYPFTNYGIGREGKNTITTFILRPKGKKPLTMTLERYLNNDYSDGVYNAKDFAVFRSGKLKNLAFLITDYVDPAKTQQFEIFIPSIRKIRRFAQPARDDAWGGADFTFGDVALRKPHHETHELLPNEKYSGCIPSMDLPKNERNKYTKKQNITPDCSIDGTDLYVVKSTAKDANWWYDYRISYVDTKRFVDYKTTYFKNGEHIKTINRSWHSAGLDDPRGNYWAYWYGKTLTTGHESMAFVPKAATRVNKDYKKKIWTTKLLKKIPKKFKFK
jgi:hypothetical protein